MNQRFNARDQLDHKLKSALAELVSQEIGFGAMSAALLKQVIVALLRRSVSSMQSWVERFSMLRDPQIARTFSEMAAQPRAVPTSRMRQSGHMDEVVSEIVPDTQPAFFRAPQLEPRSLASVC